MHVHCFICYLQNVLTSRPFCFQCDSEGDDDKVSPINTEYSHAAAAQFEVLTEQTIAETLTVKCQILSHYARVMASITLLRDNEKLATTRLLCSLV